MGSQLQYWSTTPSSNAASDPDIASSDNQSPSTLDDNVRSIMAAAAKYAKDTGGNLTAGGSANALTVTTNQVLISGQLTGGLAICIKAASTNTNASVTLAPDGLTAQAIKRADGSALAVGTIQAGMFLLLVYNSGTSEWWAANIMPTIVVGGAALASFFAYKSGNQTVSAGATTVTFDTEKFDVGSHFSSNTWTPPAGTVLVSATCAKLNGVNNTTYLKIIKNGSTVLTSGPQIAAAGTGITVQAIDQSNGSDTYIAVIQTAAVSVGIFANVDGTGDGAYFMGAMI